MTTVALTCRALTCRALAGGSVAGRVAHLSAHHFTSLAGLRDPLFGDLAGHSQVFLEDRELLLSILLELRVLLVLGLVLGHQNVLLVVAHLAEDEGAVELHPVFLLELLEHRLVDLVHLLGALLVLAALLGELLELLLGALVILNEALGELLHLLVLAVLLDELAGLDLELVVARGFADALLDVLGAHFFALAFLGRLVLLG